MTEVEEVSMNKIPITYIIHFSDTSSSSVTEDSFQVIGPRLFNSLPKYLRGIKICSVVEFKEKLDVLLGKVPDEPKISGLMPMNFQQSNSLLHQLPRRILSPSMAS